MDDLPQDFAAFLENEARTAVAAVHQFMESPYRYDHVHLFVEGDHDGNYYAQHIRTLTNLPVHHYICGGKKEVVVANEILKESRTSEKLFFFVDRDHQDYVPGQPIPADVYVTDFYSFESNLVNADYVSRFLSERNNLPASNALHQTLVKAFDTIERSFCVAARPLIATILAVRSRNGKLNLNNLSLDKSFKMKSSGEFYRVRSFTKIALTSIVFDWGTTTRSDILRWTRRLSLSSRLNWMRGKYLFWMLFAYLKYISAGLAQARKAVGKRKGRIPACLDNLTAFAESTFALDCPASLGAILD